MVTSNFSAYPGYSDLKRIWMLVALSLGLHVAVLYLLGHATSLVMKSQPDIIMVEMVPMPAAQQPVETSPVSAHNRPQNNSSPIPATPATVSRVLPDQSLAGTALPALPTMATESTSTQARPVPVLSRQAVVSQMLPSLHPIRPSTTQPLHKNIDTEKAHDAYNTRIRELIERNKEYPVMARRGNMEGKVTVRFTVARSGKLSQVSVVAPCRHSLLNKAALRSVEDVGHFPQLPTEIRGEEASFEVPIAFSLSTK